MKTFRIPSEINRPNWNSVPILGDFSNLNNRDSAIETHFQAFTCKQFLHFRFIAYGNNPIVYVNDKNKMEVCQSERVEVFLRSNDNMAPYYCLEIDATGRLLDYKANYYRDFDYNWSWPSPISIHAEVNKNYYSISGKLNISTLKQLNLIKNKKIQIGLFRGHCTKLDEDKATMEWISWNIPNSIKPDFHISSAFGTFILDDYY